MARNGRGNPIKTTLEKIKAPPMILDSHLFKIKYFQHTYTHQQIADILIFDKKCFCLDHGPT